MITPFTLLALSIVVLVLRTSQSPHTGVIRSSNTQVLSHRSIVTHTSHHSVHRRALFLRALTRNFIIGARREQPRASSLSFHLIRVSSRQRIYNYLIVVVQTLSTKSSSVRADLGIFSVSIRTLGKITRLINRSRAGRNLPNTLHGFSIVRSRRRRRRRRNSRFTINNLFITGNNIREINKGSHNANGASNRTISAEFSRELGSRSVTIRGDTAGRSNKDGAITNLPIAISRGIQHADRSRHRSIKAQAVGHHRGRSSALRSIAENVHSAHVVLSAIEFRRAIR